MRCSLRKSLKTFLVLFYILAFHYLFISPWIQDRHEELPSSAYHSANKNISRNIHPESSTLTISPQKIHADLKHIQENLSHSHSDIIPFLNQTLKNSTKLDLNKTATSLPKPTISKQERLRSRRKHAKMKSVKRRSLWDRNSTWRAPRDCPPRMGFFRNGTLARTALASMEGSGNTWIRHMLQIATGIYTGSIYKDAYLRDAGFMGESIQDGKVTVIKTHDRKTKVHVLYDRAVLLLRSPYDTFMSEINRLYTDVQGNHTGYANPKIFTDGTFDFEVSFMGEKWVNFTRNWLEFPGQLALIHYEDFQTNFRSEMTKLLRFLQWEVTDTQLSCVEKHNEGMFHRKKKDLGYDPFTDKHKRELEGHKRLVQELISQRRKKDLPFVS